MYRLLFLPASLSLDKSGEQLLRLDQGYLYVAVRVTLQEQLLLDALRQDGEHIHGLLGQTLLR